MSLLANYIQKIQKKNVEFGGDHTLKKLGDMLIISELDHPSSVLN